MENIKTSHHQYFALYGTSRRSFRTFFNIWILTYVHSYFKVVPSILTTYVCVFTCVSAHFLMGYKARSSMYVHLQAHATTTVSFLHPWHTGVEGAIWCTLDMDEHMYTIRNQICSCRSRCYTVCYVCDSTYMTSYIEIIASVGSCGYQTQMP